MITAEDYDIIKGQIYNIKFKLELLSHLYVVEQEIQASAKTVSSSISSESDIRRTANLILYVDDEQFVSDNFEINWIDKLVRLYIGIEDSSGVYHYYLIGTYLLNEDNAMYDATTHELALSLSDIMAVATNERGNQIGSDVLIPYNSNLRNALIAFVARFLPYKLYDVDEFPDTVPYDQEFSIGIYPYDVMEQLVSLFPYYEQYYSVDGVYTVKEIPTGVNDEIFLDKDFLDDLIISEERSGKLKNIKNSTEIWGAELDAMYSVSNCTAYVNDNVGTYIFVFSTEVEPEENATYSFVPGVTNSSTQNIQFQGQPGTYQLYGENNEPLPAGTIVPNISYVLKFKYVTINDELVGRFYLQGEELIHVIVREMNVQPTAAQIEADKERNNCNNIRYIINPESPYACDRNGKTIVDGEIRQVLKDNDYSYITTTELAYERAAYENYCKTRLNTDVNLKTVLIPWIDVNKKIRYTSPKTGEVLQYLVKEVQMDLVGFTMTMKLSRFYNAYPWL